MKKGFFGKKLGTFVTVLLCLLASLFLWLFIQLAESGADSAALLNTMQLCFAL
jgi:hypothetical protein